MMVTCCHVRGARGARRTAQDERSRGEWPRDAPAARRALRRAAPAARRGAVLLRPWGLVAHGAHIRGHLPKLVVLLGRDGRRRGGPSRDRRPPEATALSDLARSSRTCRSSNALGGARLRWSVWRAHVSRHVSAQESFTFHPLPTRARWMLSSGAEPAMPVSGPQRALRRATLA